MTDAARHRIANLLRGFLPWPAERAGLSRLVADREDSIWDTAAIQLPMATGGTLSFFRDRRDKDLVDFHMLGDDELIQVRRIGVHVPLACGNQVLDPKVIAAVMENGWLSVELDRSVILEGPCVRFPSARDAPVIRVAAFEQPIRPWMRLAAYVGLFYRTRKPTVLPEMTLVVRIYCSGVVYRVVRP